MARYNQTAIQDMLDGLRAAKAQIDALTKERDEARRERDCVGENEAFAHEEVERLRKHIVMLTNKLALVESSLRVFVLKPLGQRIAALEKERDAAVAARDLAQAHARCTGPGCVVCTFVQKGNNRIAVLEKAMRDMLADVEFHGHLTATAREHCAAVLAGGKETK